MTEITGSFASDSNGGLGDEPEHGTTEQNEANDEYN